MKKLPHQVPGSRAALAHMARVRANRNTKPTETTDESSHKVVEFTFNGYRMTPIIAGKKDQDAE